MNYAKDIQELVEYTPKWGESSQNQGELKLPVIEEENLLRTVHIRVGEAGEQRTTWEQGNYCGKELDRERANCLDRCSLSLFQKSRCHWQYSRLQKDQR